MHKFACKRHLVLNARHLASKRARNQLSDTNEPFISEQLGDQLLAVGARPTAAAVDDADALRRRHLIWLCFWQKFETEPFVQLADPLMHDGGGRDNKAGSEPDSTERERLNHCATATNIPSAGDVSLRAEERVQKGDHLQGIEPSI